MRCPSPYCAEAADKASVVRGWGNGYHAIGASTEKVGRAFENADAAARRAHPVEGQGAVKTFDDATLGEARIADAVDRVHRALDKGGLGVTSSDLDAIRDVFGRLSRQEREALVMRLSTRDLEIWGDQMNESRYKGGWSVQERDAFFSTLLPHLSTDALERLARTNPYLRPKFDGKHEYGEAEYWRDPGIFGPTIDDIDQGATGDCYFLAALGAVAQANPDRVRKMVRRNANGTYTVTFHERGSWDAKASTFQVTVLPEFASGLNAAPRDDDQFYMQIIEKAWAQHGEGYDKVGGTGRFDGSRPAIALEFITGHESSGSGVTTLKNFDPIRTALRDGRALTASTDAFNKEITARLPDGGTARVRIPTRHVYAIKEVRGDMIVLRNPWGADSSEPAEIMLTIDEFRSNFMRYNEVPG